MPDPSEPKVTIPASVPPAEAHASAASSADETAAGKPAAGAPGGVPGFGPPAQAGEVGTLGPYRIVKELGRGGMGAVYAAIDTRLERRVAFKVMLPQFAADTDAKERFLREAKAAARISHVNVVTVHEADERNGVPYIVMQFLEGLPLDTYLKKKGNPAIAQTVRIATEAASGLAAAHKFGLVHRDIKPANLWLEAPNGAVKVLDFGLARPVDGETELTNTGAVIGTPAYMSPEQGRGERVDHRTDLFSLGSVLYRLVTGKLPFNGPSTMAVLMSLGMDEPTPARELNPAVPESLATLIHQLLAKRAEQRPQSAAEVVQRLRAIATELAIPRPSAAHLSASQPQVVPAALVTVATPVAACWRTYLRWSDGRREVIDAPERLTAADGSILYFNPEPGEPPTEPPSWSACGRSRWLSEGELVDPGRLFRDLCERFAYFLDFAPEAAPGTTATLALWTMFTYLYPAWDAVPYLSVGGPMSSGKTRVLEVLQQVVFRPTKTENVTAATLFRTLNAHGGVMLFDEAERLRQSTPDQQEILSVFLSGYKRGGCATRLEPVGDKFRLVKFGVYGPKVLACIAGLPPTLTSRCIPIMMFRSASTSEKPKRRIDADPAGWQALRDDLHAFALEHGGDLSRFVGQRDVVPSSITGRNYELWQPLLALACWLQKRGADKLLALVQQHALASVAGAKDDAVPEADEVLLEALAERVRGHNPPTSADLLAAAQHRDAVTFRVWSPNGVTRRLKSYGISTPKKVNGERRYRDVTPAQLLEIQSRYGIELGFA